MRLGLGIGLGFGGALGGASAPSVAPVLEVTAEIGSNTAELSWTPSNRTGSPGFKYDVYHQLDGVPAGLLISTTNTEYNASLPSGAWEFWVIPVNDAGEGPSSNTVSINLPGESEAPSIEGAYLTPDETEYYTTPDGESFYQQAA